MIALDHISQRYGGRPSEIIGIPQWSGKSIIFDMYLTKVTMEEANIAKGTLQGELRASRANWPKHIQEEIRRQRGVNG